MVLSVSGNKVRVYYHLCIRHTLDTVFELHRSSENAHRYVRIIRIKNTYTAAFTYYYDPVILRNKLTPLSIFRDLALRKGDSKKFVFYFYVFYRVYTNIQKWYGLVVYQFMDFVGHGVAWVSFRTKNQ